MTYTRPLLTAITIAAAGAVVMLVAKRGMPLQRFSVEGDSMLPTYKHGDRILVYRWAYVQRSPGVGDVVVARDPEEPERWLLKRVAAESAMDGAITLLGDNPGASRDSRVFGAVAPSAIAGRAVMMYKRVK